MASADDWKTASGAVLRTHPPIQSEHLVRLLRWAEEDGMRVLSRFKQIAEEDRLDLIHDVFFETLNDWLNAVSPRAMFITILIRRALDIVRSYAVRRRVYPDANEEGSDSPLDALETSANARPAHNVDEFRIDLKQYLYAIPDQHRDIFVEVYLGDDRNVVALRHKTSRANIDRIFSIHSRAFKIFMV